MAMEDTLSDYDILQWSHDEFRYRVWETSTPGEWDYEVWFRPVQRTGSKLWWQPVRRFGAATYAGEQAARVAAETDVALHRRFVAEIHRREAAPWVDDTADAPVTPRMQ